MARSLLRSCVLLSCLFAFVTASVADKHCHAGCKRSKLNRVTYNTSAEKWVVAEKALVTVGVDASLNQAGLSQLQTTVLDKLKTLSKDTAWRITQNTRQQDQSGLERVHIEAQARLGDAALSDLRSKAKSMSKPGFKYDVSNIEYKPTNAEMETVASQVRDQLYKSIKAEIARLNNLYPGQNYFINRLAFFNGEVPVARMQEMAMGAAANSLVKMARAPAAYSHGNLGVSQKVTLSAMVVLGSKMQKTSCKVLPKTS